MAPDTGNMSSMRLLLYFLALLTGFSAAEAARPVEAASSTSTASSVALADVYATVVAVSADRQSKFAPAAILPSEDHFELIVQEDAISASTPVSRADRAHK
jgi:hypothetical protein